MPTMIDKYDAKEEKKSLHSLARMFAKTLLDGSFQRYGGVDRGSGWTKALGQEYIEKFLIGSTFNQIINVDVHRALEHARKEKDEDSIGYFEDCVAKGYEYVSIDGNNTASYLTAYINGDEDLKVKVNGRNTAKTFNDLGLDEQNDIKHTEKIRVIILREISIMEMCDLFRALNTSTHLNPQEWRQARWSILSKYIRECAGECIDFFTKTHIANQDNFDKRSHEELMAQLIMKLHYNYDVDCKKTDLDKFYEEISDVKDSVKKTAKIILENSRSCSDNLEKALSAKRFSKGKLHTFWDMIKIVCVDHNFKISNGKGFLNWFLEEIQGFVNESKSLASDEEVQKAESYTYWERFYSHKQYYKNIINLLTYSFNENVEKLVNEKIVARQRTSQDNFTFEQKLALMKLQNKKMRTGEEMSYLDLYMGKYEADHVTSVKDGGKTEIENGELMSMEMNRKKGSESWDSHFEHQGGVDFQQEINFAAT